MPTSWWRAAPRRRSAASAIAGFIACKALSTGFNDEPERASRPYDRDRDGFVMGEGAGVVVLEELQHAKARGARIYGEIVGYGMSGDAYHITAPAEDGDGAYRCMRVALKRAGIAAGDDRLHQCPRHLDAARRRDRAARRRAADGQRGRTASPCPRRSRRPAICWGRPGRSRRYSRLLAMRDGIAPPTLNLENPSVESDIDLVPLKPRHKEINTVLSNSFGFGGTNASLIFRACA